MAWVKFFLIVIPLVIAYFYLKPFLDFGSDGPPYYSTPLLRLDWHHEFQFTSAMWITLTKYHEFPFWNPYVHGGNFFFAHPSSFLISPETFFVVLFGPIKGLYYSVFFFYILGFVGCYFIGRHFKLSYLATLYLAVVFSFQSYVMNYLFIGAHNWMTTGYVPLAFYFLLKSMENWRYGAAAGFFQALIYFGGSPYIYMLYFIFAALYVGVKFILKRDINYLKGLGVMLLFSLLFVSIKMIPSIDIYAINKRTTGFDVMPFKLEILKKAFLDKHQAWDAVSVFWIDGLNFHWPFFGDYIGLLPILLALASIFLFRNTELILITLSAFLMYLTNYSGLSFIWQFIHSIPPFTILQFPARFVVFFVLMLGILGAKLVSKIDRLSISSSIWPNLLKKFLIAALVLFIFTDLAKSSYIIIGNMQPLPMQNAMIQWDDKFEYYDFYQRFNLSEQKVAELDANYFKSFEQIDTLSNKGVNKRGLDPIGINKGTILSKGDPGYKGEYYFADDSNSRVQLEKWSPNTISLKVYTDRDNILIVNQNYQNQWKTKENFEVINYNELLGIKIPKGEHTVHIYVFQNKLLIGLPLFLIGIILGAYLLMQIK